ncbi:queuosine precursor transporter [Neolewinella lacunae]|uniref:Probable queuosine precursor transporter n=1 Tax=Neolewinella lacunae TaxID=1517758 RepID=A0A923PKU2_9BACT|nr:queuosine precursor transporter [Neolewinella lacunae]MBC6995993.1 queuosine precursor transporter [Neolewinella lacunae]MDN3633167.1 queuosine precursor transporter [Neolewinella lacunae]
MPHSGPTPTLTAPADVITYRPSRLFIILAGFFVANALVAELIGVKIFALEDTLGIAAWNFNLFGEIGALQFSAGVVLWPIVFVMTDLLNEYYGRRGVRMLSFLTVALISYAFLMIFAAIQLAPADWWVVQSAARNVPDSQAAFAITFGQGLFIIVGSLAAFLLAQLTDVFVFQRIRGRTGEGRLWLRATGSTVVSQLVDSLVVLIVAFKLGPELFGGVADPWPWSRILAVATVQYTFKFLMAVVLTPVIYLLHGWIDRYLGHELAEALKARAGR